MPDQTPGEICYVAFEDALSERQYFPAPGWDTVTTERQRAWEAAAQAVRDLVLRDLVEGGAQARQERHARADPGRAS